MANISAVDNDEMVRGLFHTLLTSTGHHGLRAKQDQEGIHMFWRELPHITIPDFAIPDINGRAVPGEIRVIDPQAPVIRLTGGGQMNGRSRLVS